MAPRFEALDQDRNTVRSSDLLARGPLVLIFYPRAMTAGCTRECRRFRDLGAEFAAFGAQRVGISIDTTDRQAEFAEKEQLDFPLLSDRDRAIAKAFGVKRPGPLTNRRSTFVIAQDSVVLEVVHDELDMDKHADKALAALRRAAG